MVLAAGQSKALCMCACVGLHPVLPITTGAKSMQPTPFYLIISLGVATYEYMHVPVYVCIGLLVTIWFTPLALGIYFSRCVVSSYLFLVIWHYCFVNIDINWWLYGHYLGFSKSVKFLQHNWFMANLGQMCWFFWVLCGIHSLCWKCYANWHDSHISEKFSWKFVVWCWKLSSPSFENYYFWNFADIAIKFRFWKWQTCSFKST